MCVLLIRRGGGVYVCASDSTGGGLGGAVWCFGLVRGCDCEWGLHVPVCGCEWGEDGAEQKCREQGAWGGVHECMGA